MNPKLPHAIANYFQAANAHSTDAVIAAFTGDAIVTDESREHSGIAAIRKWSDEVIEKYKTHAEPADVTEVGDQIVVTAKVSGTFPGSPIELRFSFILKGDKISALLIEA